MATTTKFNPKYEKSWALVVGVNAYTAASPLNYACNDASIFANQLTQRFGFPADQVTLLLDKEATLENVRAARLEEGSWGPIGRFGWKYTTRLGMKGGPCVELVEEAKREGEQWGPVRAGMFGGSTASFLSVADRFQKNGLDQLHWW